MKKLTLVLLSLLALDGFATDPSGVWTELTEAETQAYLAEHPLSESFQHPRIEWRLFRADHAKIAEILDRAPHEREKQPGVAFTLPTSEGSFEELVTVKTSIMSPEMEKKYPQL